LKVSIVTCTWNSEPWLAQCIDSVRSQDHPDIEHVFVDGGSTDGTLERIAAVQGNVKVIEGIRGGISRAMNEGVRVATGEIVAHLHSDDFYAHSRVVSTVVRAFEARPQAVWLYGRCKSVIDGKVVENAFVPKRFSWSTLIRRNIVPHPATFIRRQAFLDLGGFDPSYKYTMDYDLWLRLARVGPPIELDEYLAAFRQHAGSLSTSNPWACHNECLRVRLKHAGRNPAVQLEHYARHVARGYRMALGR
jgi:glycosyltransferase involved in cell wall biosynthesis